VPGADLVGPAQDRAAELADLGRAVVVLEIVTELGDEGGGEVGIRDVVDAPHGFLRVPGSADLAAWVTSVEEPDELRSALVVESFGGFGEQAPASIQRAVLPAAVAEGVVLDPPSDLVEAPVRELHQMERIGDLVGVGEHRVERQTPGPRQVQHRPQDASRHASGWSASQSQSPAEDRPAITSSNWPDATVSPGSAWMASS